MKTQQEIEKMIMEVMEKQRKYEPNSIMGVHWSSKLAGLKKQLEQLK